MWKRLPNNDPFADFSVSDKERYKTQFAEIIAEFADEEESCSAREAYEALLEAINQEMQWHIQATQKLKRLLELIKK